MAVSWYSDKKILVVDDCPANRALLGAILGHRGVSYDEAADGAQAVAKLETGQYDLVLMDIQMPKMDGRTATAKIRHQWPPSKLPIVAITASVGDTDEKQWQELGFNGHMLKPFALKEIDCLLKKYVANPCRQTNDSSVGLASGS